MNYLERNLLALTRTHPELAARLCWPLSTAHIRDYGDGRVDYQSHLSTLAMDIPADELAPIELGDGVAEILVFGVGLGEQLSVLLEHPSSPDRIHAWEDDPWLLRACLERYDFRAQIFAGRLVFHLGVDLVENRELLCDLPRIKHPILQYLYTTSETFLDSRTEGPNCLMCSGSLFVEDCSNELIERGFQIYPWNTERLATEELEHIIGVLKPELLFAINYRLGLQEIARKYQIPVLCWEIDPSLDAAPKASSETDSLFIFSYRQANVDEFEHNGFTNVQFLPLATSPTRRHPLREPPELRSPHAAQVAFVGASMYQEGQARLTEFHTLYETRVPKEQQVSSEIIGERLEAIVSEQRLHPSEYRIESLLQTHFPELQRALDSENFLLIPAQLIAEICAAHKRFDYVNALAEHTPAVWGDDGWLEAKGIDYRGLAGHHQEITLIYSNAEINVDIGRIYQSDIVTMRVFDVLACEGFLLTEHSPAIEEHFTPGYDLETYTDLDELCAKVSHYLKHPEKAREIGKRGRHTIEAKHTFTHRFDTIFQTVR